MIILIDMHMNEVMVEALFEEESTNVKGCELITKNEASKQSVKVARMAVFRKKSKTLILITSVVSVRDTAEAMPRTPFSP